MQPRFIQIAGIIWTVVYAGVIVWLYATEPRSFKEVATNSQVAAGVYEINQEKFDRSCALRFMLYAVSCSARLGTVSSFPSAEMGIDSTRFPGLSRDFRSGRAVRL